MQPLDIAHTKKHLNKVGWGLSSQQSESGTEYVPNFYYCVFLQHRWTQAREGKSNFAFEPLSRFTNTQLFREDEKDNSEAERMKRRVWIYKYLRVIETFVCVEVTVDIQEVDNCPHLRY